MLKKIRNKSFILLIAALVVLTYAGFTELQASALPGNIPIDNLASSYTEYTYNYNIWTSEPESSYKDVYSSYYSEVLNSHNDMYRYIDSHKGPTAMRYQETVTDGTTRSSSFSGSISNSIVKMTIDCAYENSTAVEKQKEFTFPVDNKTHTLYVTRTHIDKEG